jgi:hypothetical protein
MRHRSSRAGSSMPNGRALIPRRSSAQIARASVTASGNTCPMTRAKPGESSLQRRIKERMAELGIPSWRALSLRAGLGETLVKTIMNGRSRAPRSDTIRSLARALKLSPDELFEAVPHSERAPQPEDETTRLRKLRGLRLTAARNATWDSPQFAAQELGISYDDLMAYEHGLKEPDGALYLRLQQFGIGRNWIVHGDMGGLTQVVAALVGVLHPEVVPGLSELLARRGGAASEESETS